MDRLGSPRSPAASGIALPITIFRKSQLVDTGQRWSACVVLLAYLHHAAHRRSMIFHVVLVLSSLIDVAAAYIIKRNIYLVKSDANLHVLHIGPQSMNSPRPNEAYYAANGRGSYYNNGRPESYYNGNGGHNGMSRPESSFDHYNGNGHQPQPQRQRYPRTASEGAFHNGHAGVYPTHGNQPSYETVTTASGGSADPIGYQTDPSSDNSSLDRVPPVTNPTDNYGFDGFGNVPPMGGPGYDQYAQMSGGIPAGYAPQNNQAGPPPPPHKAPIKLGSDPNAPTTYEPPRPGPGEKRKSWLGKRLSRK